MQTALINTKTEPRRARVGRKALAKRASSRPPRPAIEEKTMTPDETYVELRDGWFKIRVLSAGSGSVGGGSLDSA